MIPQPTFILFCADPLAPRTVDPDFQQEFDAAQQQGFTPLLFSYEDLCSKNNAHLATRRIAVADTHATVVYRGWMLTPQQYTLLYHQLEAKNYILLNTPEQYRLCHYLPASLALIEERTPKTVFEEYDGEESIERLIEKARVLGSAPLIVKDYVKSEKHHWAEACFVPSASDTERLRTVIHNFLALRGDSLNVGVVLREFVELNALTIHSQSAMPLTEEYRLFFYRKKLIGCYTYWEEGDYHFPEPDTHEFELLAQTIDSSFFSMDIARTTKGTFIIVELGDGQVSGLPRSMKKAELYQAFAKVP